MTKDKAGKAKGRKGKTTKSAAVVTSDEDEESEVEGLIEETQMTAPLPRPKPRPVYRSAAPAGAQDLAAQTDDEDRDEIVGSVSPASVKDRPRSKATYRSTKSPGKSPSMKPQSGINGTSTFDSPRKRGREDDNEEQSATDEGLSPAHGTQSSDIQVRKRVRH